MREPLSPVKPRPEGLTHEFTAAEGWILSERADGFWEIQRLDEAERFANDDEAFLFVVGRAANDPLYAAALACDGFRWR